MSHLYLSLVDFEYYYIFIYAVIKNDSGDTLDELKILKLIDFSLFFFN